MKEEIQVFWFRRDLRWYDNHGLYMALTSGKSVVPLFIFDKNILDNLTEKEDARVSFIFDTILALKQDMEKRGKDLIIKYGYPLEIWKGLLKEYHIKTVFVNHDYEPYAIQRDTEVKALLETYHVSMESYKDHVIFEKNEITKEDGLPYTVFTPYKKKWLTKLTSNLDDNGVSKFLKAYDSESYLENIKSSISVSQAPSLEDMGFSRTKLSFPSKMVAQSVVQKYDVQRDYPAIEGTSRLGIHFRFGTISIRQKALGASKLNQTYLNELIWRDFYSMILDHFPYVAHRSFKSEYDKILWLNDKEDFDRWCQGKTGYPLVDAGMRQLSKTGWMHNRVRMVTASFLTKHLLIDWRLGERWFAQKLLDFDLSSNNGGWQWAAGCGTDAAPYFRIFNPQSQALKFDKDLLYIKKWVPEFGSSDYMKPIVEHGFARERCLKAYKEALKKV